MSAQQVLFDAPGPRARRNIMIGNIIGGLIVLGILAWVVSALAGKGQLAASMWTPFLESRTWEFFILPGLVNTLKAAGIAIVTSVVFGLVFGVGRLSHVAPIRWVAGVVVEFLRAVPVLLMMIFFWLALGSSGAVKPQDAPLIAVVVAYVTNGAGTAIGLAIAVVVVQQTEGNLLQPLIMGKAVKLHPVVILLALGAGAILAGVIGAVLAVPASAVIWAAIKAWNEKPGQGSHALRRS